jgi:hypothetical protein
VLLARVASQPAEILWRRAASDEPFAPATFTFDRANRWLIIEAKGDAEFLISTVKIGQRFIRGDANAGGSVDIADAVFLLMHLFTGSQTPPCAKAADVTGNSVVEIADAVYLLHYLFRSGAPPPPPSPACGLESIGTPLPCDSFPPCGA